MTGQFGKNHLGDRDDMLPTAHGFDEFFGNLYHLNAEEEPEHPDYPKDPAFKKRFGPRGVIAPAGAFVGQWLQSFKEFPPRQKPGSFNLDRVTEAVTAGSNQ